MKANELMLGDLVIFNCFDKSQVAVQVTEIRNYTIYAKSEIGNHWANPEDVEPIPLTTEILEKNGWYHSKFDGSYGRKAMRLDGTYKDKLPDGVDNALSFAQWSIDEKFEYHLLDVYLWKGSVHLWIEYVHELQHVFKLCGIDKKIVL